MPKKRRRKPPVVAEKRPRGRPSKYSAAVAERICQAIATSSDGLRKICEAPGFPNPDTVYLWIHRHPEFSEHYARAREMQAQSLFDELIQIANTPKAGSVVEISGDGSKTTTISDMTNHRRLQVDTYKWVLSKLLPKKYGEAMHLKHSDLDGKPIIPKTPLELLTDEELAARIADLSSTMELGKTRVPKT